MCDEHKVISTRYLILGAAFLTASIVVTIIFTAVYIALYIIGSSTTPWMFAFPAVLFIPPAIDLLLYKHYQAKYKTCRRKQEYTTKDTSTSTIIALKH